MNVPRATHVEIMELAKTHTGHMCVSVHMATLGDSVKSTMMIVIQVRHIVLFRNFLSLFHVFMIHMFSSL